MTSLAAAMAKLVRPPLVIYLEGDLGAGKTTFTRALIQALGYAGRVKSPTYGLLEKYPLEHCSVLHLDLYRIAETGELEFLGIEDLYDGQTILMVEWPDRGGKLLPTADLTIRFTHDDDARVLEFIPSNEESTKLCLEISQYFQ